MAESRRGRWVIAAVTLAFVYWVVAVRAPSGTRSLGAFEPDKLADLEVGMWKAYYAKEKLTLFRLLVSSLREQYHFSWQKAVSVGFRWADAAATFGDATSDYDKVLPDLESGYATVKQWIGAKFDPAAAARAELSWWTARRDPASGSGAEKNRVVAERMTDVYAIVYEVPRAKVAEAAKLRVEAADLRDRGTDGTPSTVDWKSVAWLLHESYRSLHAALNQ
jgi:hypothetical protein